MLFTFLCVGQPRQPLTAPGSRQKMEGRASWGAGDSNFPRRPQPPSTILEYQYQHTIPIPHKDWEPQSPPRPPHSHLQSSHPGQPSPARRGATGRRRCSFSRFGSLSIYISLSRARVDDRYHSILADSSLDAVATCYVQLQIYLVNLHPPTRAVFRRD